MGGAIQSCCAEGSSGSPLVKKKKSCLDLQKKQKAPSTDDTKTTDEKCSQWEQKNGQLILSDQYLLRLLGQLIPIQKQMCIEDFQTEGIIGTGSFGVVYLGQLKSNISFGHVEKYAIKRIAKQILIQQDLLTNVRDQKEILAFCNSKFLVSLIMAFQDPWYVYLVMEYAAGGDTYSLVQAESFKFGTYKNLGESAVRFIGACVVLALECLHAANYMYRDLKPQNVLIFDDGYVKLTDFGLVKKSMEGKKSMTISGTQFYYAPEMVLRKGYDKEIDFWALGVYLYELSNYEPPFQEEEITKANFQKACLDSQNHRKWINENMSAQLKDLINSLLKFNSCERLGVVGGWKDVKNHPFFKKIDWEQLSKGQMVSPLKKIVDMFPSAIKPYKIEPRQTQTQTEQKKIEGWSLVKKNTL